jgi:hypothetical protein
MHLCLFTFTVVSVKTPTSENIIGNTLQVLGFQSLLKDVVRT